MQRRWRWVLAVGVLVGVVAVLLYRCNPSTPGGPRCTTCPPSSLPREASCDERRPGDVLHNSIVPNSIVPNSIVPNSIVPNSVGSGSVEGGGAAPNQQLLEELARSALARDLFTAAGAAARWQELWKGPAAPDLIRYVVSCALDPGERIDLPAWPEVAHLRDRLACGFTGELGLCGQAYRDWATAHPPADASETRWSERRATQACLERVSSCILARVNAVDAKVPLSMRGDGTTPQPAVPVQTEFRENRGTPIQSFKRCDRMCLWGDRVRRNCDWEPRFVGQCVRDPRAGGATEPARKVRLRIASSAPLRVRICKGIYGCDDTDPAPGAGAATEPVFAHGRRVEFPAPYGGQLLYQGAASAGGTIELDCPDNGSLEQDGAGGLLRTGYYSVMLGSLEPGVPVPATAEVALAPAAPAPGEPFATHDRYPAPEPQVFTYREGGFHGNLFVKSEPLQQYACASEIWREVPASATDRHCAGGLAAARGCFANEPGRCDAPPGAPLCTREPAAAGVSRVYDACLGGAQRWERPYTTYLNHPCDLFATDDECLPFLDGDTRKAAAVRWPIRVRGKPLDVDRPKQPAPAPAKP